MLTNKRSFALFIITILLPFYSLGFTGQVITSYKTPGNYPTGMTFDGKYIWMADRGSDELYCIDPANGKVVRKLESPAYWPLGMAWDGKYLWNADLKGGKDVSEDYDGIIYKLDPENGDILQTLVAPSKSPVGLAWDGNYLWSVDDKSDELIQFNPEDGTTIRSFKAPSQNCSGLAFDGKYLWVSDNRRNEIYMVDPSNGKVIILANSPGPFTSGLCYDGTNLWAVDYQEHKLYKLKVRDDEQYIRENEAERELVYTQQVKNFGPGKILTADMYLAIPVNRVNQEIIGKISYNQKPDEFVTDRWGQETAHYHFTNIKADETETVEMTTHAKTWDVRYFIYPEKVGSLLEIPADVKGKYLEDNEKFQIHDPIIQDAVKASVGAEKNPYWIVRKIFDYINDHMYYEMSGGWNTAPTVLARGNGSCSEYTFVFISMCRASGIPARYVGSVVVRGEEASMDDVFHRWVEVYLPNYGWVPVDPSRGDKDWGRDQAFAIGYVAGGLLVTTQSGGGSKTMQWTYNSNEFWTTQPKTYVNWENYGDWQAVEK
jgi:transglutaminase-like putative cysteine protease/sugar lactone lactonase YvrE